MASITMSSFFANAPKNQRLVAGQTAVATIDMSPLVGLGRSVSSFGGALLEADAAAKSKAKANYGQDGQIFYSNLVANAQLALNASDGWKNKTDVERQADIEAARAKVQEAWAEKLKENPDYGFGNSDEQLNSIFDSRLRLPELSQGVNVRFEREMAQRTSGIINYGSQRITATATPMETVTQTLSLIDDLNTQPPDYLGNMAQGVRDELKTLAKKQLSGIVASQTYRLTGDARKELRSDLLKAVDSAVNSQIMDLSEAANLIRQHDQINESTFKRDLTQLNEMQGSLFAGASYSSADINAVLSRLPTKEGEDPNKFKNRSNLLSAVSLLNDKQKPATARWGAMAPSIIGNEGTTYQTVAAITADRSRLVSALTAGQDYLDPEIGERAVNRIVETAKEDLRAITTGDVTRLMETDVAFNDIRTNVYNDAFAKEIPGESPEARDLRATTVANEAALSYAYDALGVPEQFRKRINEAPARKLLDVARTSDTNQFTSYLKQISKALAPKLDGTLNTFFSPEEKKQMGLHYPMALWAVRRANASPNIEENEILPNVVNDWVREATTAQQKAQGSRDESNTLASLYSSVRMFADSGYIGSDAGYENGDELSPQQGINNYRTFVHLAYGAGEGQYFDELLAAGTLYGMKNKDITDKAEVLKAANDAFNILSKGQVVVRMGGLYDKSPALAAVPDVFERDPSFSLFQGLNDAPANKDEIAENMHYGTNAWATFGLSPSSWRAPGTVIDKIQTGGGLAPERTLAASLGTTPGLGLAIHALFGMDDNRPLVDMADENALVEGLSFTGIPLEENEKRANEMVIKFPSMLKADPANFYLKKGDSFVPLTKSREEYIQSLKAEGITDRRIINELTEKFEGLETLDPRAGNATLVNRLRKLKPTDDGKHVRYMITLPWSKVFTDDEAPSQEASLEVQLYEKIGNGQYRELRQSTKDLAEYGAALKTFNNNPQSLVSGAMPTVSRFLASLSLLQSPFEPGVMAPANTSPFVAKSFYAAPAATPILRSPISSEKKARPQILNQKFDRAPDAPVVLGKE